MSDDRTPIVAPDADNISAAARRLREGGLVAFPTETVYGLGADATNDEAVAAVFQAKDRPRFNPLIVHVGDLGKARAAVSFNPAAETLAEAFWPGALTMVLPRLDGRIALLVSAGLDTVAVRVPNHPVAQALLAEAGVPVAAPSANKAGCISPTAAGHVVFSLPGPVKGGPDMILDGGPCHVGVESTVIDLSGSSPVLLRPGGVAAWPSERRHARFRRGRALLRRPGAKSRSAQLRAWPSGGRLGQAPETERRATGGQGRVGTANDLHRVAKPGGG